MIGVRTSPCERQLPFLVAGENQTTEHYGEKDVLFTTAGHIPEKETLDLDLIGGTLWLELWGPRPFVHGAS